MDMMPLKPERKAQLEEYAKRRGQDPETALDDALATYLEWERQDFAEAGEGIRRGQEDVKAGRTRPATDFFAGLRRYGLVKSFRGPGGGYILAKPVHEIPVSDILLSAEDSTPASSVTTEVPP